MNPTVNFVFVFVVAFVSCNQVELPQQNSQNAPPQAVSVEAAYKAYVNGPTEQNFELFCDLAKQSEHIKYKTMYFFYVVADFMHPGLPKYSKSQEMEAISYLKENRSTLGDSLEVILSESPTRNTRWATAEVIGFYGDESCLPVLQKCLEDEVDEVVTKSLKDAIARIGKREQIAKSGEQ